MINIVYKFLQYLDPKPFAEINKFIFDCVIFNEYRKREYLRQRQERINILINTIIKENN